MGRIPLMQPPKIKHNTMTPPNTLPFNLQEFLAGKPIVCRNGFVPTDAHYFEKGNKIAFTDRDGDLVYVDEEGLFNEQEIGGSYCDLFHPYEQKEGWVHKSWIADHVIQEPTHVTEDRMQNQNEYVKITWYE